MPRVIHEFVYDIRQTDECRSHPDAGDDDLLLRFVFDKVTGRVVQGEGNILETRIPISDCDVFLEFSYMKQVFSDAYYESVFREKITRYLSGTGVPESCFAHVIDNVFQAVDIADSPNPPLSVCIYDMTWVEECDTRRPVPAAESSIEGLERVRLAELQEDVVVQQPSCAICLADFAQERLQVLVTRLPCSHLYHLNCIVMWLERNNLCPVCRHPMPTQDQEAS